MSWSLLWLSLGVVIAVMTRSTMEPALCVMISVGLIYAAERALKSRRDQCGSVCSWLASVRRCGLWMMAGFLIAAVQFDAYEATRVRSVTVGEVSGCIVTRVVTRHGVARFVFAADQRDALGRRVQYRLAWRQDGVPESGSCWRLNVRLKPPRGARNEVGFDYERWLYAQRISGVGSVRGIPTPDHTRRSHNHWQLQLRERLYSQLRAYVEPYASGALIIALGVGIRDDFSPEDWDVLRRSGTAHLMAISGLHVGLAAMLGFCLGRYAPIGLVRQPNLLRRGAVSGLAVATAYALVAGFAVPTLRALLMLALWYGWRWFGRRVDTFVTLQLAAVMLLLAHPWMVVDTGLWLSAGAVAVIAFMARYEPSVTGWRSRIRLALRVQLAVTLLMLPVTLTVSGGISWFGVPINLMLLPLFSLIIVPLVLLLLVCAVAAPAAGSFVVGVLGSLLDPIWQSLSTITSSAVAFSELPGLTFTSAMGLFVCGVLFLLPKRFPGRSLALIFALPAFFLRQEVPSNGTFHVDVLDVGQALAVVVQTHRHFIVYDAGNAWPGGDSGARTLVPFLRAKRARQLHTLIISHADRDHAGGARSLQGAVPAQSIRVGEPVSGLSAAKPCRAGDSWTVDAVTFTFLHPPEHSRFEGNQQSCVLLVQGDGHAALFTGDLGGALERRLLPKLQDAAVGLVVGAHHGSLSSSDPGFVQGIKADSVVFSNGHANQWGMPRIEIVQRWRDAGTRVYTTARYGQLRFTPGESGWSLAYYGRQSVPGRWRSHSAD